STSTWVANYVGRVAKRTGTSSTDWLASNITGGTASTGTFTLNSTQSTQFGGQSLNHVGGPNYWAPSLSVAVNDGTPTTLGFFQHSQVSQLTLTFNEAVTITDPSAFSVVDAQGHSLTLDIYNGEGLLTPGATGVTTLLIAFNNDTSSDTFAYA